MIGIFLNSHLIWVTQSFRLNYVFNSINISLISQCINRKNFLNFIVLKHQTFIPARVLREPLGRVCSIVWPWLPSARLNVECHVSAGSDEVRGHYPCFPMESQGRAESNPERTWKLWLGQLICLPSHILVDNGNHKVKAKVSNKICPCYRKICPGRRKSFWTGSVPTAIA